MSSCAFFNSNLREFAISLNVEFSSRIRALCFNASYSFTLVSSKSTEGSLRDTYEYLSDYR